MPKHNDKFRVKPKSDDSAFVPWIKGNVSLKDILCLQATRMVNKDNTISYNGKILQIEKSSYRHHYVKKPVTVHEYVDGKLAVFLGPRCLGLYDATGHAL